MISTRKVERVVKTVDDTLVYVSRGATIKELAEFLSGMKVDSADSFHQFEAGDLGGVRLTFRSKA